jgi:DnaJ-domain-containing protein 1
MGSLIRLLLFIACVAYLFRWVRRATASKNPTPRVDSSPYDILGVRPGASADQIRSAYRQRLAEYHPDKVATLGKELRDLALTKTETIIAAYQTLQKRART